MIPDGEGVQIVDDAENELGRKHIQSHQLNKQSNNETLEKKPSKIGGQNALYIYNY